MCFGNGICLPHTRCHYDYTKDDIQCQPHQFVYKCYKFLVKMKIIIHYVYIDLLSVVWMSMLLVKTFVKSKNLYNILKSFSVVTLNIIITVASLFLTIFLLIYSLKKIQDLLQQPLCPIVVIL